VTYKLGLIHDHNPPAVPDLAEFAVEPIPNPPSSVPMPLCVWPMADNDRLGCCAEAGRVHVNQAGAEITTEPWTYQGDASLETEYFGLTGGQDTGLLLPQVLVPWHEGKLAGGRNGGYAVVNPKNTTAVKQGIWIFGNLYIGVNLPEPAQDQFRPDGHGVWELTGTAADYQIEGGHCVVPISYSPKGVQAVTWGGTVLITWQWWATYVDQVYAVVPPAFLEKGGDARGFDLAAIDAYLPKV
jgi:hypothetical protein